MDNIWTCHCGLNKPERFSKGLVVAVYCPVCYKHEIERKECAHADKKFVRYPIAGGNFQLREICTLCHEFIGGAKKHSLVDDIERVPIMSENVIQVRSRQREIYFEVRRKLFAREKEAKDKKRIQHGEDYRNYLNTAKWSLIRNKALERDGYICQSCLVRRANQVHHKTYEFLYNEPLFTLVSVCEKCHREIHNMLKGEDWEDIHQ